MQEAHNSITDRVMQKIESGEITMRPKIYFIFGSVFLFVGTIFASIIAIFAISLTTFVLRAHGPFWRWQFWHALNHFPWWILIIASVGIVAGIFLLKRYDFSYKKNFSLIAVIFLLAVVIAGWFVDETKFNRLWINRGPMRQYWQDRRFEPEWREPRERFPFRSFPESPSPRIFPNPRQI